MYFSIIIIGDCTPDSNHQEQMSIRKPEIKRLFLSFVSVEGTAGLNLSTVILDKLNELKIPFEDWKEQPCG